MNSSQKPLINLEELSKQFRDAKFKYPPINERFSAEFFTLGFISALQALNGINKVSQNLQGLISLRNLEANGKITTKEKLEVLQDIIKLTDSPLNPQQLSSLQVIPEKWKGLDQTIVQKREGESPTLPGPTPKRSKSIEGKQNMTSEKSSKITIKTEQGACSICGGTLRAINLSKIQGCGHSFHENCLKVYLQNEVNKKNYPIYCPLNGCKREVEPLVVQAKLDSEHSKKYWDIAFAKNLKKPEVPYSWCPTQGCKYFYIAPKPLLMMFRCPLCQKHYCLNCRAEYHRGQTCDTYQKSRNIQPQKIEKDPIRLKQCPKCQNWVEHQHGTNLKCNCGYDFCVNCGNNEAKCLCNTYGGANRNPIGSNDFTSEETYLYKMIMEDQADENARIKDNIKDIWK